ncbi:hypothetical protein A2Y85_00815 [candidate division WOR-3 bacterium RBG_13_43_14]|uniref:Biotin transporter n=1 Tax=candidate division WOR-3 bacterium RBG_13_43_14 TaxID=1802590 RepID=A0A1F4U478_UNCW3|nr:MAG: hypothetical protein A2Y85_00815 [candidate division WOR-3 bacterium RBG_13_43_14]
MYQWEKKKIAYYTWLFDLAAGRKLLLALFIACFTGISAQIRIPLGFTPVPVTGQVFAVLLSGILLGHGYGAAAMLFYLIAGFAGMPWFTGGQGGMLIGPTTGYLIGFVPAAALIGWLLEKKRMHNFVLIIVAMFTGILIIYIFGAINFALFMKTSLKATLTMAVLPFVAFDIVKAIIAAGISKTVIPYRFKSIA